MIMLFVFSLIYLLLIASIYFIRKRIDNKDTRTYKKIIIVNIIVVIIDIIQYLLIKNNAPSLLIIILNKIYLISTIAWITIFANYIYEIGENKIQKSFKKASHILYLIFLIGTIILPLNYVCEDGTIYSTGLAIDFTALIIFLEIAIMVISMCIDLTKNKNNKNNKNKKYIPLLIFAILGLIATTIQAIYPELLLTSSVITFITILMFFFIENPDIKMIEQLEAARDQADKANRAKTDFLSSMSHEIRTPLNAIVGFSDCINHATTLEEAKENASDVINASNTLLEIVNGILDISKIEAGKLEIVNSKYNAKNTFEELAKLITPKMQEKGLDFSYYIAPDLPTTLYGDHSNIKKVITNLLSNAAKYTDKGFVRYEVNCINTNNLCKLIISVEDSGRGIKQENINKLFTKFQRLEEDRNTTIEGTGLGLAITKQLVELMGGKIIVHTVYGEGSKFTVVINQQITEEQEKLEELTIPTTLNLKDVKILIVDDNNLNLKVATKLLERFNANNITCCESGFTCLDKINSGESYDVILMDDMMPKMSGVETLKKLKENQEFKTPVIALTANAITGMREKYLSEGFTDYLAKPIEKEELIKVMNKVLNKEKKSSDTTSTEPPKEEISKAREETNNVIKVEDNIEEILENTQKITPIKEDKEDSQKMNKYLEKEKFLRRKGIDLDKSLELLGDMEMYEMTLKDFSDGADTKWLKIINYKNTNDLANYAIEVHSLKSDAKYLGFMRLAEKAYEHELKSKENDEVFVNNHFQELEEEYNRVIAIIDEYNNLNTERFTVFDLPN
ncbi:MAG: response regulator [bacterium]|nr:response regulator [bacterium]